MQPIHSVFSSAVRKWSHTSEYRAGMAALAWDNVLGPELAAHIRLSRISDGIAWVRTSSSGWAHQLLFVKEDIQKRLNEVLGAGTIKDIRIARGHAERAVKETAVADKPVPGLSRDDRTLVQTTGAGVQDPLMRAAFERAMEAMLQRQRSLQDKGWVQCQTCGTLTDESGARCFLCRHRAQEERNSRLIGLMLEYPWISFWDLQPHLPDLQQEEYARMKGHLLRCLWNEVVAWQDRRKPGHRLPEALREKLLSYCMMRSGLSPRLLSPEAVEHFAGKKFRDLLENRRTYGRELPPTS